MRRKIALIAALLLAATLVVQPPAVPAAEAAEPARGCRVTDYWGVCFDTLPKLHCCSAAFMGWSEIVVGDRFPVAGNMKQDEPFQPASALQITYPSGRTERIPVSADGRFAGVVTFDEEGYYRVSRVEGDGVEPFGDFAVGYRTEFLNVPAVEAVFGQHHYRSGVTVGLVEADKPVELRIRFTDARGEPVRSRTLAIGWGEQRFVTDGEGVATLTYEPQSVWSDYSLDRVYPGLAVRSYREVTVDGGVARGLPGGDVAGYTQEGRVYLPLREFLEKADTLLLADAIQWNNDARTVEIGGISVMIDTGMVLGGGDYRAGLQMRSDRTYMELDSLIRLLDRLGMASRTGEFSFRLSMAQEP